MKRIEYKSGQTIGPYGVIFINEVEPKIEKSGNKRRRGRFLCPFCKQNSFIASFSDVKSGHTRSCGCYQIKRIQEASIKDITGKRFGKLVALKRIGPSEQYRSSLWHCKCDCGGEKDVPLVCLTRGLVSSCGCLDISVGELKIGQALDELDILYEREKTFLDCINSETGHHLHYDFYLPNYNCCIEYDGTQHFIVSGWNTADRLAYNQKLDEIKNRYCLDHNIKLIRIPYTEIKKIDASYLKNRIKKL